MKKYLWSVGTLIIITGCGSLVVMSPRSEPYRANVDTPRASSANAKPPKRGKDTDILTLAEFPPSLMWDEALETTGQACAREINKTWKAYNHHRGGNIAIKIAEVLTATSFTVLSGVNAGINGDIGENPKKALGISSIVAAGLFTGLASFDGWYSFNERTNNLEKDTRKKLTLLYKAGQLAQCAWDLEASAT